MHALMIHELVLEKLPRKAISFSSIKQFHCTSIFRSKCDFADIILCLTKQFEAEYTCAYLSMKRVTWVYSWCFHILFNLSNPIDWNMLVFFFFCIVQTTTTSNVIFFFFCPLVQFQINGLNLFFTEFNFNKCTISDSANSN